MEQQAVQGSVRLSSADVEQWMHQRSPLGARYDCDGVETLALSLDQARIRDAIAAKVRSGEYTFEQVPCAVCGGESFDTIATKDRYGLFCPVVACNRCGLLQTNPRMTPESYASFYEDEFPPLYRGADGPVEHHFQRRLRHGRRILKYLQASGALPGKPEDTLVADIGCSHGGILRAFQEAGYQTLGVDLNDAYLDYGRRNHGLDLRLGKITTIDLPRTPDVVLYVQVFEHIADPRAELATLRSALGESSRVYIEVPGVKNLVPSYHMDFLRLLQNAHVYHYTTRTLSNLFASCGLRPITMNNRIQSVFAVSPQPGDAEIVSDYDDVMRWLRTANRLEKIYPVSLIRPLGRSLLAAAGRARSR